MLTDFLPLLDSAATPLALLADSALPSGAGVKIVFRVLHISAAIALLGSLFYMRAVLAPAGADACFAGRRKAWAVCAAVASLVLIVSGIYNFLTIYLAAKDAGLQLPSLYHMLFGIKCLLALDVMAVAALLGGGSAVAEKCRARIVTWLNLALAGGLAIVIIAAVLKAMH